MTETEDGVQRILLANGLAVEIRDESVHMLGDRWQVRCVAQVTVPVSALKATPLTGDPSVAVVRSLLGDSVEFMQQRARPLIPEVDRAKVFTVLRDELLEIATSYVARPSFPVKLVRRRYQEALRERTLRRGMVESISA